ncbi:MAG: gliding motility-associated C-terminal domain-containing protein, partial [Pedobacter sp.]
NLCSVVSQSFVITSSGTGISESNGQISNAYCGQSNGAVRGIVTPNNVPRIWYNSSNAEVSRSDDLVDVAAGTYYFKAQLGSCEITSPNYTVANIEFNYRVAIEQVYPATCAQNNGSITITSFQGNEPDNLKWFNANGLEVGSSRVLTGLSVGTYRLVGYSNFGCSYLIKEYTITEVPKPNINLQNLKQYINCDGKSVTTSGIEIEGQSAPYSFSWLDQNSTLVSTTLNLRNAPIGKYILNITDGNGCAVQSEEIDFTQLEETILKIPNAFTPNGDSVNDLWEIKGMENYPDAEFSIFNRNGNVVFRSRGYDRPFDGTHNGKQLPVGVYFYKINLNTECGVLSGSLTIIR